MSFIENFQAGNRTILLGERWCWADFYRRAAKSTEAIEIHGRLIVAGTMATTSKSAKAAALTNIKLELSKSSRITATVAATSSALLVGQCLTAVGSVNDIGLLTARSVTVSAPTSEGCTGGFRGA
jgi:hypothetical protein